MKKTVKNYFTVICGSGFSRGLSFLTSMILARHMGANNFGIYTIFFTVMMLFWLFPTIIDGIYVRFAKAEKETERLEYIKTTFLMKCGIFIILIALAYPLAYVMAHFAFNKPRLVFDLTAAIIAGASLSIFTSVVGIYQAEEKFHIFSILNSVFYALVFFLVVVFIFLIHTLTPFVVILIYSISAVAVGSLGGLYLFRITKPPFRINFVLLNKMMHFGKWLLGLSFIDLLLQRMDVLVLARLVSYEELGVYSVAVRIAMFAMILSAASSAIFMPKGCESLKSRKHLKAYFKESLVVTMGLSVVILALIAAAPLLIKLFFGMQYSNSLSASRILLLDTIFVMLYMPFGYLFLAKGDTRQLFIFMSIKLALTIVAMLILVPRFGVLGAALAFATASFLCLLIVVLRSSQVVRVSLEAMKEREVLGSINESF